MDSPSNQFMDFLGQLPPGPFIMVCGSALMLMLIIFWIGYLRPRIRQSNQVANTDNQTNSASMNAFQQTPPVVMPQETPAPSPMVVDTSASTVEQPAVTPTDGGDDLYDLPDLDALVDTTGLIDDAVPEPETIINEQPATPEPITTPPPSPVATTSPEPEPIPKTQMPASVQLDDGERVVQLDSGFSAKVEEVITVLRDTRDGRLVVQVDDLAYRSLVDSPDVKKQFVAVMKELSTVVTEPDENPPQEDMIVEEAPPQPAPKPPVAAAPPRPMPGVPPAGKDGALPGDLPKFDLEDSVTPQQGGLFGNRVKYEAQPVPELDIAGSIEAFLQYKLSTTGAYPGREIHVHSAPGGGVSIQVDQTYYEAVSDVADPEIREYLSSTIQEWQERQ